MPKSAISPSPGNRVITTTLSATKGNTTTLNGTSKTTRKNGQKIGRMYKCRDALMARPNDISPSDLKIFLSVNVKRQRMKMRYKIHRRFYNLIAKIYNLGISIYFNKEETNPRNAIAKLISEGDSTLLEVCAGTCENSITIAKRHTGIHITAIDMSRKMLDVAKWNILKDNIPNIDVKVMDASNLELGDKKFDVVVISLALHEMEESMQQAILLEMRRVLKDDGKCIVVEWDRPKSIGRKMKFAFIELIEPRSYRRLMKQDMDKYFGKVGFKVEDTILCDYTKVYTLRKGTPYSPLSDRYPVSRDQARPSQKGAFTS